MTVPIYITAAILAVLFAYISDRQEKPVHHWIPIHDDRGVLDVRSITVSHLPELRG